MSMKFLTSAIQFTSARTNARTCICPQNASTRHMNGVLRLRSKNQATKRYSTETAGEDLKYLEPKLPYRPSEVERKVTFYSDANTTPTTTRKTFYGIIRQLKYPQFLSGGLRLFRGAKTRVGVVILVTPRYAPLLDNNNHIPELLRAIIGSSNQQSGHADVDVMVACVDGVAPRSLEFMDSLSSAPLEGISFFCGASETILPDLFVQDQSVDAGSDALSSLTFSGEGSFETNITMPLANTLFIDGKRSTLRASRWQRPKDGPFEMVKSVDKHHQVINAFTCTDGEMSTFIPATPLTPARPMASGLGNIVRSIEFDDGTGPASRELEPSVDLHREKLMKISKSAESVKPFGIWALVFPKAAIENNRKLEKPLQLQLAKDTASLATREKDHDYIERWVRQGAFLCRVLSGGGGWGAKQGMLSLDPQTTYHTVTTPPLDFTLDSIEEQQASALGNIAKPGDLIQFYAGIAGIAGMACTPTLEERISNSRHIRGNVAIGTIPSTTDSLATEKHSSTIPNFWYMRGRFGAVSQSGIFLSKKVPGDLTSPSFTTKLDVPYSYVFDPLDCVVLPGGAKEY